MSFWKNLFTSAFTPISAEADELIKEDRKQFEENTPSKKNFETQSPDEPSPKTTDSTGARDANLSLKTQGK